jgi:hypothetical protein
MAAAPNVDEAELKSKEIWLEKKTDHKKMIIFDLDETLVHCLENAEGADAEIEI